MRVPLVASSEWDIGAIQGVHGSVHPASLVVCDLDDDGEDEVILGTTEGQLLVFRLSEPTPLAVVSGLYTINEVVAGEILGIPKALAVCCLEGLVKVWTLTVATPNHTSDPLEVRRCFNVGANLTSICRMGKRLVAYTLDRRLHVYGMDSDHPTHRLIVTHAVFSMVAWKDSSLLAASSHGLYIVDIDTQKVNEYPLHATRVQTALTRLRDHAVFPTPIVVCSEDGTVALFHLTECDVPPTKLWEVHLPKVLVLRPLLLVDADNTLYVVVTGWSGDATIIRSVDGKCIETSLAESVTALVMMQRTGWLLAITFTRMLVFPNLGDLAMKAFCFDSKPFVRCCLQEEEEEEKGAQGEAHGTALLTAEQRAILRQRLVSGLDEATAMRKLLHGW